ncbi:MAG TPA: hypothetical protein VEX11_03920 [Acetobacteraceae bacterium]|nr:hypothetical protein [Acetobacteraceae bacterium]
MAINILFTQKTLFASLLAIGIAGGAQAQAPSTLDIIGHAPGQQVGNIVGGGTGASLQGGGDNLVIQYNQPGAGGGGVGWEQPGRSARFASTHGDGLQVEYFTPGPAGLGREAWVTGGGDNTGVSYTSPYQRL